MLKVQYVRTFDDYVGYVLHITRGLSSHRRSILQQRLVRLFIFGAGAGAVLIFCDPEGAAPIALALAAMAAWSWYKTPAEYWKQVEKYAYASAAELGTKTTTVELTLTEESLELLADEVRIEVPWARMLGIAVFDDRTYIRMVAGFAAVVPRAGFERDRDYLAVRDFALRKLDHE